MPDKANIVLSQAKNISRAIHVPFAIAGETLETAEFTLVQIKDSEGLVGMGEGSPFSTLTGDNIHGVLQTTQEILSDIEQLTVLGAMQHLRKNRDEYFTTSPSAYVAVEMALWDLYGKQVKLPLAALWGQRMKPQIMTDITLPIMPAASVKEFWSLFKNHNFEVIKIKVSGNLDSDLDLIHAMLSLVPRGTQFTLDGNKAYDLSSALQLIERLKRHGHNPIFFEQPLPADDWQGLKTLESYGRIPVCLDETVVSPEDAIKVVEQKTASMINLKIMKSGIEETIRIIAIARSAGIALMIGGMLESEIAMGASLQLACGAGWISHFDLDTPFFFKDPVCLDSPWSKNTADLICPKHAGIGLELVNDLRMK